MKHNIIKLKKKNKHIFSAPGGTLSDDMTCTDFCLFKAQEDMETMQAYAQVISLLNPCSVAAGT